MSLRFLRRGAAGPPSRDMDPLAGIANLFDASIVLVVSMMMALFTVLNAFEMFDDRGRVTLVKQSAEGEMEIITREGTEIRVERVTDTELSGAGVRLGVAFKLPDGRVVYVPE